MEGKAPATSEAARRFRLASPLAVVLGVLTLALTVLYVPLAWPARDFSDGWQVLLGLLSFALPGVVVARRQPGNPIGWILIGLGMLAGFYTDTGRYAVLDYHFHRGNLPFGPAAALVASGLWTGVFLVLPLVILLFPDGRLPRRWRMVLWAYVATAALVAGYVLGVNAWDIASQPAGLGRRRWPADQAAQPVRRAPGGGRRGRGHLARVLGVFRRPAGPELAPGHRRAQAAAQIADERGGHHRCRPGRDFRA